jgi:hypothetical protein
MGGSPDTVIGHDIATPAPHVGQYQSIVNLASLQDIDNRDIRLLKKSIPMSRRLIFVKTPKMATTRTSF